MNITGLFKSKIFYSGFVLFTIVVLLLGGLGYPKITAAYSGLLLSLLVLTIAYFKNRRLILPKGILFYFLVLQCFFIGLLWSVNRDNSVLIFINYLTGGVFWIALYNLKKEVSDTFIYLIIILSTLYSIFYVIRFFAGLPFARSFLGEPNLVFPMADIIKHNHLGDLWAIAALITSYLVIFKKKYFYLVFVPIELFFLATSFSRSSYLSLIFGVLYIIYYNGGKKLLNNNKKLLYLVVTIGVLFFLMAARYKDVIFSRPYFFQAVEGIYNHPFGVGMGNFQRLSYESMQWVQDPMKMSAFAHNIFLEVGSGIGVLSIFFLIWLFIVVKQIFLKTGEGKTILIKAIFLALSVNFLFDYTYCIPTMLWLWFMSIGLAQE